LSAKTSELAEHFADLEQQHEASVLGMWIFLATELMVFGALFAGYTVYRAKYPVEFEAGSHELNVWIAAVNTAVLLTSSLTMVLAVHAAQVGARQNLVNCLIATGLLGALFLVIKAFEYHGDYTENLVPGLAFNNEDWAKRGVSEPGKVQLFLMFYYVMTGLHAVHLIIGIGIMGVLAVQAWRGRYTPQFHGPVEVGGLYWHFVDVVWIFLLPLLYLIGPR
jgi:cytochrome c oxidase subunit III